ncbi:MAG: dNTP triphosphohydrolase [Chloroflexi bacterium]|nr:dNTP triphosphohydrolase [Chloroflexota bacterium]
MEPLVYGPADAERLTPEAGKPGDEREPWEIDRARILHSAAFRRLQRKTQVFSPDTGDNFRTRLTHSIEVSQIAKGIALRVGANPTLCEAASLAHDIGHPPFGHAGEAVLNDCMAQAGGFEGNAQNLRVLMHLEVKSDDYEGLNLTRATIDAMLKYKRSHSEALKAGEDKFFYDADEPLVEWVCQGARDAQPSFECQVMDWSDDVAYSVHDVEDGMWAGLISAPRLQRKQTREAVLAGVPSASGGDFAAVCEELQSVLAVDGDRAAKAARKTWSSWAIYEMVHAARAAHVAENGRGPRYARRLSVTPAVRLKSRLLKAIAEELVFRHMSVARVRERAGTVVRSLFTAVIDGALDDLLPADVRAQLHHPGQDHMRIACDYIAGMTDDYAMRMYRKIR